MGLTYTDGDGDPLSGGDPSLGDVTAGQSDWTGDDKEVISDGGTTITWDYRQRRDLGIMLHANTMRQPA